MWAQSETMILAFDTSSAACTAALFDGSGACVARIDEMIGRGHAERLVPLIEELLQGRKADEILVGVGPGSFTGIRVGIAAAHGLAIGWDAKLSGMDSLALLAASARGAAVATAVIGGHGEMFVQQFDAGGAPASELMSLPLVQAVTTIKCPLVIGSAAAELVEARGWGESRDVLPSAGDALALPADRRSLPAKPVYARAPDAKIKAAA